MPNPATRRLLRRHAVAFAVSFVSLTALLLANYAAKHVPQLSASRVPADTIVEALLLAVPFTAAMTVPMAVFVAVLWVFTRLGAEGVIAAARRERHGVRWLVAPVLGVAAAVAALTLVSNTEIVPRGGVGLVIGASCAVVSAYYVCLVAGESLADRLVVSPFVAMWMANALLLAAALLVVWRSRWPRAPRGAESLAIGG